MEQMAHNGVSIAYEDAGKGAPPMLLIHDVGSDRTSLSMHFDEFRRHHRVLAADLPGHGQSGSAPRTYTPAEFAADLAWLCYELGIYRPVAVGFGAASVIAQELAVRFPDLPAAAVAVETVLCPGSAEAARRLHQAIDTFFAAGTGGATPLTVSLAF